MFFLDYIESLIFLLKYQVPYKITMKEILNAKLLKYFLIFPKEFFKKNL